jgi:hypothetical protein
MDISWCKDVKYSMKEDMDDGIIDWEIEYLGDSNHKTVTLSISYDINKNGNVRPWVAHCDDFNL